jgi:hypothetical protein
MEYRTFRMSIVSSVANGAEVQLRPQYGHEDFGVPKDDYMRHYKVLHLGKHFIYSEAEKESHRKLQEESLHQHEGPNNPDGTINPCLICDARHFGEELPSVPDLPTQRVEVDICIRLQNGMKLPELKDTRELDTPQPYIDAFVKRDARRHIDGRTTSDNEGPN